LDQDATPDKSTPVADQVVNWLLLLRSGRASQSDYADFLAWRAENPMHESAWQQLTSALGSSFGRLSDFYPIGFSTSNARPSLTPAMAAYRSTPRTALRGQRRGGGDGGARRLRGIERSLSPA
jgi:transmembrane sensor